MESYKTPLLGILLLTLLAFIPTSASAQILYDNGVGTTGGGDFADSNNFFSEAGNVFTASLSGTVNYVDFSGLYYGGTLPTNDTFVLSLYSTSSPSGPPESLIIADSFSSFSRVAVGTHDTGTGLLTVYQFSGSLQTPFNLTAGTSYYFGISDVNDSDQNFAVGKSDVVPPGGSTIEYSLESASGNFDGPPPYDALAFQLESVPEPKGWALVILACIGLGWAQIRARRSQRA